VPELDEDITCEEVCLAIRKLKCRRSPGVDGLPAEVYKALPDEILHLLTEIFNGILLTGEYPDKW